MSSRSGIQILLLEGGGEESALSWKLGQSALVEKIFVAPGAWVKATGMNKVSNLEGISNLDYPRLLEIAKDLEINLVVPGPGLPIVEGLEGFREANIPIFVPSKERAQMDGSNASSKSSIARNVQTVKFTDYEAAKEEGYYLPEKTPEEALEVLENIMLHHEFVDAGAEVVIEDFMDGDELIPLMFRKGGDFQPMSPAQDDMEFSESGSWSEY